jgi:hypothetical protein
VDTKRPVFWHRTTMNDFVMGWRMAAVWMRFAPVETADPRNSRSQ